MPFDAPDAAEDARRSRKLNSARCSRIPWMAGSLDAQPWDGGSAVPILHQGSVEFSDTRAWRLTLTLPPPRGLWDGSAPGAIPSILDLTAAVPYTMQDPAAWPSKAKGREAVASLAQGVAGLVPEVLAAAARARSTAFNEIVRCVPAGQVEQRLATIPPVAGDRIGCRLDPDGEGWAVRSLSDSWRSAAERVFGRTIRRVKAQEEKQASGLHDYAAFFPLARSIRRRIVFHCGPTNSGKTHAAVEPLCAAPDGVYLAPLRLLALEGYERIRGAGLPAVLLTGEERSVDPAARHVSSTVEMLDTERRYTVAVIDEIQMLGDDRRGWAWTQALAGVAADTVYLCGSQDAIPYIEQVLDMTGEEFEVRSFERLQPLVHVQGQRPTLADVRQGDAVIAFTRRDVLALRETLQAAGLRVATLYGNLGPEVRRAEAERFRTGDASVVVATDAIGMGLNLPIRRVLFTTVRKYDGTADRLLTPSEIRQIAGRAGRYGLHECGEASAIRGIPDAVQVNRALAQPPSSPDDVRLSLMPPWRAVDTIGRIMETDQLKPILERIHNSIMQGDRIFRPGADQDVLTMAAALDTNGVGLSLRDRYGLLGCPVDTKPGNGFLPSFCEWVRSFSKGEAVDVPAVGGRAEGRTSRDLSDAELGVRVLGAYIWIALRHPDWAPGREQAEERRRELNRHIEAILREQSIAKACRKCGTELPAWSPHAKCDPCHYGDARF